jgi:putative transcriptional regulator
VRAAAALERYRATDADHWAAGQTATSTTRQRIGLLRAVAGAACAVLLLSGPLSTAEAETAKALTAILIAARSELPDPNFSDSIVLVMNNLGPAPVGIIVNRPTKIPVSQLFPEVKQIARLHDKVYFGGPVEFPSVWFLFRAVAPPEHAVKAFDGICLSADRKLLLQLLRRDKPMDGLRIFIGHAGWGPGQLEAEIGRGDWTSKRADSDAIFDGQPERPWPAPAPSGPPVST